jgi:hypothetical protein
METSPSVTPFKSPFEMRTTGCEWAKKTNSKEITNNIFFMSWCINIPKLHLIFCYFGISIAVLPTKIAYLNLR